MAGKIIGLFAEAKDKLAAPQTWRQKFAQDAAWTISSGVEFVGTMPMLANAVVNKKMIVGGEFKKDEKGKSVYLGGGKTITDPTAVAAQLFNASAYPVKSVLPKAEKHFDLAESQARLVQGAVTLQKAGRSDKITEVITRVASDITEQMGSKSPGLANIVADTLEKLEKFHGISALSLEKESRQATMLPRHLDLPSHGDGAELAHAFSKVNTTEAIIPSRQSKMHIKSLVNDLHPHETMAQHVTAAAASNNNRTFT